MMNRKQVMALGIAAFLSVLAIGFSDGISADDDCVEIGSWNALRVTFDGKRDECSRRESNPGNKLGRLES